MPKVEQEPDPRRRIPGFDGVAAGAGNGCVAKSFGQNSDARYRNVEYCPGV